MASAGPHESSSSRFPFSYHVFLSFRGKDTRNTITDHLYTALTNAGIRTFRDDDELERGENIEFSLQKAIEESKISVVVFSKNYASSRWCLGELVEILQQKSNSSNRIILPVFYHVTPAQVRHQTESFAEAFARHEERLKAEESDERKREGMQKKIKMWKEALRHVSDLSGMELHDNGQEAKFIQDIVKEIVMKLNRSVLRVPNHLVGIQSFVSDINSWVQDGSSEVDMLVMYGMGGRGKTTIAKVVYYMNFDSFEGSSFLADIKDNSEQHNGLVRLQKQLLSTILKGRNEEIHNIEEGAIKIREAVSCKRLLLVLDDVDHSDQLDVVVGMRDWFHPGSKIIITTRNKNLPKSYDVCKLYRVPELNVDESLQLFNWRAFGQGHHKEGFLELSKSIVEYCGGVPLALKVLGSSLCGKSKDIWLSQLEKLERIGYADIVNKLKISYDGLPDIDIKNVFLHIACFFLGEHKEWTIKVLDSCVLYTTTAIDYLSDRCLLDIAYDDKLTMHQLIRDMGRDIVRQESPDRPEKRTRLWHPKDCITVLSENIGTNETNAVCFDVQNYVKHSQIKSNCISKNPRKRLFEEVCDNPLGYFNSLKRRVSNILFWHSTEYNLHQGDFKTNAFTSMKQLKLLKLNYVKLEGSYKEFPKQLRWMCWHGFHLPYIPSDLFLENVVSLDMQYSNLTHAWKGYKHLPSLKILNLSHSKWLSRTPNFSGARNLERLILKNCVSLVYICESIESVERLAFLDLSDCTSLKELPSVINGLRYLESLIISGCSSIYEFPVWLGCMESLREFNADRTKALVPISRECRQWSLPRCLVKLRLQRCNLSDSYFPRDFCNLPNLEYLNLDGNLIQVVPICITTLNNLFELTMRDCPMLQSVEGLPSTLRTLIVNNCDSLETIRSTSNLSSMHNIGCKNMVEVEGYLKCVGIEKVDRRIVRNLGLLDFQLEEEVFKKVKVSYEHGIFIAYFGGKALVESCCDYIDRSGSETISFTIPADGSNRSIQGLNVCFAFHGIDPLLSHYYKITNRTKDSSWIYGPICAWNIERFDDKENEDGIIMLSHWRFGGLLDVGDQLTIELEHFREGKIKEIGVKLVYQDQEADEEDHSEWKNNDVSLSWTEGDDGSHYYQHLRNVCPGNTFLLSYYYQHNFSLSRAEGADGTHYYQLLRRRTRSTYLGTRSRYDGDLRCRTLSLYVRVTNNP